MKFSPQKYCPYNMTFNNNNNNNELYNAEAALKVHE